MNIKNKKRVCLFTICVFALLASGCGYRNFEDNLKEKIQEKTADREQSEGDQTTLTEDGTVEYLVTDCNMDGEGGSYKYIITKAVFYGDVEDSGISVNDFSTDGQWRMEEKRGLILLNVTMENIDCTGTDTDGSINVSAIMMIDSTDEKGYMTDPTDEIFFGPDYLDIHGTGESDYWNVYVEPGKKREMKIGCLVPAETLEKAEIYWVCLNTKESSRKMTLENGDENK